MSAPANGADHVVRFCDAIRTDDETALLLLLADAHIDDPDDPVASSLDHLAAALRDAPLPERTVPVLLMLGSLSPAKVARHRAVLREIVGALPDEELIEAKRSPRPHVRAGAVLANHLFSSDETPMSETAIARQIDAPDEAVTSGVDEAFASWPRPAVVASLWSDLPELEHDAAAVVAHRLREIDADALRVLTRSALERGSERDLLRATVALGALPEDGSRELRDALSHPAVAVRVRALTAIARRDDALDAIGGRVLDAVSDVRRKAVALLAVRHDPLAARHLLIAASDPVPSVASAARAALVALASPSLVDELVGALDDTERSAAAADVLAELADDARGALLERVGGSTGPARERIVQVLQGSGADRRLVELLEDPHPLMRGRAAEAIAALAGPNAAANLAGLLRDPEPEIRSRAAELIGETHDTSVRDALAMVQLEEPDARVRDAIARALRRIAATETDVPHGSTPSIGGRT